ncbi:MAG: hypothetical protein KGL39_14230 [Patescibacteria group bacterium]|nr:hypothetical protein [Patescibacteria group bacterium]
MWSNDPQYVKKCRICAEVFTAPDVEVALHMLKTHLAKHTIYKGAPSEMCKLLESDPRSIDFIWPNLLTGEDIAYLRNVGVAAH